MHKFPLLVALVLAGTCQLLFHIQHTGQYRLFCSASMLDPVSRGLQVSNDAGFSVVRRREVTEHCLSLQDIANRKAGGAQSFWRAAQSSQFRSALWQKQQLRNEIFHLFWDLRPFAWFCARLAGFCARFAGKIARFFLLHRHKRQKFEKQDLATFGAEACQPSFPS